MVARHGESPLRVVGWGPLRLRGERRRMDAVATNVDEAVASVHPGPPVGGDVRPPSGSFVAPTASVARLAALLPVMAWVDTPILNVELGELHAAVNKWTKFIMDSKLDIPLDDFLRELQAARTSYDVEKLIELGVPDELVAQTRLVSTLLSIAESESAQGPEGEDAIDEQRERSGRD